MIVKLGKRDALSIALKLLVPFVLSHLSNSTHDRGQSKRERLRESLWKCAKHRQPPLRSIFAERNDRLAG
jgi:hypothetical protein